MTTKTSILLAISCALSWGCPATEDSEDPRRDGGTEQTPDALNADDADTELDTVSSDADGGEDDAGDGGMEPGFTIAPGTQRGTIASGGRTREFNIRIPPNYDGASPLPLLFVFHGGNGEGAMIQNSLGFDALTDRDGAIAVYPDGIEKNWADGRGTTDASLAGVDDIGFVADLIDHMSTHLNIDDEKVWVTGVSNGGFFTQHLACELSDRIDAIAPVISALPSAARDTCRPGDALPMLAIQGTEDAFITFEGGDASHDRLGIGDGGAIESADTTRAFWAERYGCTPEPEVTALEPVDAQDSTRATLYAYRGCQDGARIDYYIVTGMGHTWPPNEGATPRVAGQTSKQLDATELIWAFFNEEQ